MSMQSWERKHSKKYQAEKLTADAKYYTNFSIDRLDLL